MSCKLVLITVSGVQEYISNSQSIKSFYYSSRTVINYINRLYSILSKEYKIGIESRLLPEVSNDEIKTNYFLVRIDSDKDENKLERDIIEKIKSEFKIETLKTYIVVKQYEENYVKSYKAIYKKLDSYKNNKFKSCFLNDDVNYNNDNNCSICGKRREYKEKLCKECYEKQHNEIKDGSKHFVSVRDLSTKSHYYVLIKADFDNLGKHMSGSYLLSDLLVNLREYQKNISKEIYDFGESLSEKIKKCNENIQLNIYKGGDDILFFCPIEKVQDILNDINLCVESLNSNIKNYKHEITMSISIVIAQRTIPLKNVIKMSKNTLEEAKNKFVEDNKNAIGISLIDSSSTIRTSYVKNNKEIIDLIFSLKDSINSGLIYELEMEIWLLGDNMEFCEYEILIVVIKNIIKKVVSRRIVNNELSEILINLLKYFVKIDSNNVHIDLKQYFDLLHMMDKYFKEKNKEER